MKKFYLTTPIYYVNDVPHIGHAYTTIMADVIKRYKKLMGYEAYFLTGTDEHGQKIEKSAAARGISPKQLADQMVAHFKELWRVLNIDYDQFIRTTDDFHISGVQKIFQKVREKGDIYLGKYEGYYCISCENYIVDRLIQANQQEIECPDCGRAADLVSEPCYFFRLSAYQERLLEFYRDHPGFVVPQSRMNEVISFVSMGLKDLSVSRSTVNWGVPVPGDEGQTIYVWFDALPNYITAVNYLEEGQAFQKYWPADLHIMAKDILKYHAVYWPAFLMSAGIELPHQELIHGWWLKDEKKISKSTGNVLDPHILLKFFNADAIRYFLMREAPIGADGNFSHQGFINRINSDLSNDWGNLVSRTGGMVGKYFKNKLDEPAEYGPEDEKIKEMYLSVEAEVIRFFDNYQYNRGLEKVFSYINILNRYIVDSEPWVLAKSDDLRTRLAAVLKTLVRAILSVNTLLSPVIPETAEKVRQIFSCSNSAPGWKDPGEVIQVNPGEALFPRVSLDDFFADEQGRAPAGKKEKKEISNMIEFSEFKKVEMVVSLVKEAEKVEKSKKLLKLKVDTGSDTRTVVAGVAQHYEPADLLGKKVIIVKNLKPVKLMGIESQGMILAATDADDRPHIPVLPEDTPIGSLMT